MPYESGMDPIGDARQRFDVRYYLVAIEFLIFDVELLLLYPWAVAPVAPDRGRQPGASTRRVGVPARRSGRLAFVGALVFLGVLIAGFVYTWKKGVYEWR